MQKMKEMIRVDIKKIKTCEIYLPQTARKMEKGSKERHKEIWERNFLKKLSENSSYLIHLQIHRYVALGQKLN